MGKVICLNSNQIHSEERVQSESDVELIKDKLRIACLLFHYFDIEDTMAYWRQGEGDGYKRFTYDDLLDLADFLAKTLKRGGVASE